MNCWHEVEAVVREYLPETQVSIEVDQVPAGTKCMHSYQ